MLTARLWADVETHAGFGEKYAGGPGDLATARWIAAELADAGYTASEQLVDVPCFPARSCELVAGGERLELFPQPIVVPTPPEGISAEVALIFHPAQAARAAGRIAVLVTPFARHATIWGPLVGPLVEAAHAVGALALIILPSGPSAEIVALNTHADRPHVPLPIAIGRPADLARYAALETSGAEATLLMSGEMQTVASPNIIGRLERGERWIGLSTPRTGFFTSVVERGSGTAAFLAIARQLAASHPDHSVFVLNSTAHEFHFLGTHNVLDQAPAPESTDLWVHFGAGLASRDRLDIGKGALLDTADPNRILMATENLLPLARRLFAAEPGLASPQPIIQGAGELSSIVARGYRHAFAVMGVNRWLHTRQDDLEKLTPELLEPVVEAHMAMIDAVARA